jgi:hypothetical protein
MGTKSHKFSLVRNFLLSFMPVFISANSAWASLKSASIAALFYQHPCDFVLNLLQGNPTSVTCIMHSIFLDSSRPSRFLLVHVMFK